MQLSPHPSSGHLQQGQDKSPHPSSGPLQQGQDKVLILKVATCNKDKNVRQVNRYLVIQLDQFQVLQYEIHTIPSH